MSSKMFSLLFCVFTLLVITQGQKMNLDTSIKCYNYATCDTDGPDHQKQHKCIMNATPEDLQDAFEYVEKNGYFTYQSKTEPEAVKEYCGYDDQKKTKAFTQTLNGILAYQNKICGSDGDKDQCSRITKALNCLFPILDGFHSKGKC